MKQCGTAQWQSIAIPTQGLELEALVWSVCCRGAGTYLVGMPFDLCGYPCNDPWQRSSPCGRAEPLGSPHANDVMHFVANLTKKSVENNLL